MKRKTRKTKSAAVYFFIGGAYADSRWQSVNAPTSNQMHSWSQGDLEIFRVKNGVVSQPDGTSGMWARVETINEVMA